MTFPPFDPLEFKNTKINDAALSALKREISNILSSYVGWYDPFCELIQNALDAVEARAALEKSSGKEDYVPRVDVRIDLDANLLVVTDNGIGLDKEKFEQFLAPNFSFKSGKTRGHKGVGATYVAYGFNYMRVSTKVPGFAASGRIVGARNWLRDQGSPANPKVEPDGTADLDPQHALNERGVSITVRFDDSTHPRRVDWIKANNAQTWLKILSVKTGLGAIQDDEELELHLHVVANKKETTVTQKGAKYLWLHTQVAKKAKLREIEIASEQLFKKFGVSHKMPDKFRNLDFIYDKWSTEEISNAIGQFFDDEEKEVLNTHTPTVSFEFGYTAKIWTQFNDSLNLRKDYKVLTAGIQLAANNMPQGEIITIPLNRNIGRQNQIHFLFHFDNYTPDLGRKGFHRELSDFAKNASKNITDHILSKHRSLLKPNTGVAPDLVREMRIGDWKKQMLEHEAVQPLELQSKHFFKPTERVSITSAPTREQDVIALFNQLVAGGVIRGIRVMSTNERFTYDGLYKVAFDLPEEIYTYEPEANPLGVSSDIAAALKGKVTDPRVLEYKFSLDGLIEDFEGQDKNINDVDLCIVWETGATFKERYGITTLLIPENADQRQYHGVTHILNDMETGAKHCDLIVLSELMQSLNDPLGTADQQREKYE
jgi:hypothetical protein